MSVNIMLLQSASGIKKLEGLTNDFSTIRYKMTLVIQ